MIVMFSTISLVRYSDNNENNFVKITISHGDTLWEIAQEYNYNNMDTNTFITKLKDMNHLNGKTLRAGDQIIVPVSHKDETYLTMDQ